MGQWQFIKGTGADAQPSGEPFDDGAHTFPGDEDFSTDAVQAEAKARKMDGFSYMGASPSYVASEAPLEGPDDLA